jgi:uncharacterized membrane protein
MLVEFYNRLNKNEKWIAWAVLYLIASIFTTPAIIFLPFIGVIGGYFFESSHKFFNALNEVGIWVFVAGIFWGLITVLSGLSLSTGLN